MDSSRFFVMLKRELLCRFSFLISGATQLTGFVIGVTGGVLFPVAFGVLLLLVFVFDVKACSGEGVRKEKRCFKCRPLDGARKWILAGTGRGASTVHATNVR